MADTLSGIDISNHNGSPDSYRNTDWYQAAQFVIVQAIDPPPTFPPGVTDQQLRAARDDGKTCGVYVWLWNSFSTSAATQADIAARLALIPDDVTLGMRLWLDMEDTTQDHGPARQQDVLDALEVMDAWANEHGLPASGVYSGDWYIRGYMDAWFPPDRVYWQANYALSADEAVAALLPMRPAIQYTSTPVDTDVMLASEINAPHEPTAAEFRQALSYLKNDVMAPLRSYKLARIRAAVAEVDRVAAQYGAA